jgi:hypothetical protein
MWWRYIAAQLSIIAKEVGMGCWTHNMLLGLRWAVGWQCRDCGRDLNVPEFSPAPPRYKRTVCAPGMCRLKRATKVLSVRPSLPHSTFQASQ